MTSIHKVLLCFDIAQYHIIQFNSSFRYRQNKNMSWPFWLSSLSLTTLFLWLNIPATFCTQAASQMTYEMASAPEQLHIIYQSAIENSGTNWEFCRLEKVVGSGANITFTIIWYWPEVCNWFPLQRDLAFLTRY